MRTSDRICICNSVSKRKHSAERRIRTNCMFFLDTTTVVRLLSDKRSFPAYSEDVSHVDTSTYLRKHGFIHLLVHHNANAIR